MPHKENPEEEGEVTRCLRTGSPCGTDTRPEGTYCRCIPCIDWLAESLKAENTRLQERVKELERLNRRFEGDEICIRQLESKLQTLEAEKKELERLFRDQKAAWKTEYDIRKNIQSKLQKSEERVKQLEERNQGVTRSFRRFIDEVASIHPGHTCKCDGNYRSKDCLLWEEILIAKRSFLEQKLKGGASNG